ncbi:MAG: efflux RND transporter periplasmic adaptor subunit [Spirochaetaceae bacterium]|nr:efflux RND transporter periplasmic adaptor subunit [Spirochaetaceae bacterium]
MNKKKIIAGTIILLIAAVISIWVFIIIGKSSSDSSESNVNLQGIEAVSGSVAIKVEGPSVAEPVKTQTIRSALEGTIIFIKEEGDSITKGDVLAALDERDNQNQIRQAEINLSKAQLTRNKSYDILNSALTDLEGKKKLSEGGAISADHVEIAKTLVENSRYNLSSADLDVAQAKLALEVANKDLENTKIHAPFSGVVLSSALTKGDLVNKGSSLLTIADISKIKLTAEIDEFDIVRVKIGQKVTITSDSLGDKILSSTVSSISPAAEIVNNISIFKVSAIIDNKENILKPGMSADIAILIKSDNGLIVPSKAVSSVRTRSYIKVFEGGEIVTKKIKTGADNGINIVVLDGLNEGDLVVVEQAAGFSLSGSTETSGSSVIPISVPGVRK